MDAIIVNIERFHNLNTLNGRDFGDEVLRTLGGEIDAFLRETEGIASRSEGDHFDIYCAHREDYQALLDRFQSRMNDAFPNADIRMRMGVMPWQEGVTPEQMFNRAWTACSMVRGNYKTHLMVYDEDMRRRDELNLLLQNDLSRALEEHALQVYYQPKYDIQCDPPKLSSAEALVRWRHPGAGHDLPGEFHAPVRAQRPDQRRGQVRLGGGRPADRRLARPLRRDAAGVRQPLPRGRV